MKLHELMEILKTTNPTNPTNKICICFNDEKREDWGTILVHYSYDEIMAIKNCEVVKFEEVQKRFYIYIVYKRQPVPGKEYYFRVWNSAECRRSGYVKLTIEQAQLVAFATNSDNWKMVDYEPWSGCFGIDLADFRDVEEVEGDL